MYFTLATQQLLVEVDLLIQTVFDLALHVILECLNVASDDTVLVPWATDLELEQRATCIESSYGLNEQVIRVRTNPGG